MTEIHEHNYRPPQKAQAVVEFEEDPHRAAIEDNPAEAKVGTRVWIAIFVKFSLYRA